MEVTASVRAIVEPALIMAVSASGSESTRARTTLTVREVVMALVKGYARMWPREIFDNKATVANSIEFLDNPGVYVLYNGDRPHYIGQTDSLFRRLREHANPRARFYHFWNLFSAFAVDDGKVRDELEAILIAAMPTANSAKPKLNKLRLPPEVANLMRRMRDAKVNEL